MVVMCLMLPYGGDELEGFVRGHIEDKQVRMRTSQSIEPKVLPLVFCVGREVGYHRYIHHLEKQG